MGKWKPEVGRMEAGSRKMEAEVGKWKPEVGKWKPEVGRMEAGSRKMEVGNWKMEEWNHSTVRDAVSRQLVTVLVAVALHFGFIR